MAQVGSLGSAGAQVWVGWGGNERKRKGETVKESGYKVNLLKNARFQMKRSGGRIAVRGSGVDRTVSFYTADGRSCVVWFPTESRVNAIEEKDIKDAIEYMSGFKAFQE